MNSLFYLERTYMGRSEQWTGDCWSSWGVAALYPQERAQRLKKRLGAKAGGGWSFEIFIKEKRAAE